MSGLTRRLPPAAKKLAATAVSSTTALAWKRLGWQARAALAGGSLALGAFKRINGIRRALTRKDSGGRRRLHASGVAPPALPAAAAALLQQRQAVNPVWAPAVGHAMHGGGGR